MAILGSCKSIIISILHFIAIAVFRLFCTDLERLKILILGNTGTTNFKMSKANKKEETFKAISAPGINPFGTYILNN